MSGSQSDIQNTWSAIVGQTLSPSWLAAAASDFASAGTDLVDQGTIEAMFHTILGRDPTLIIQNGTPYPWLELQRVTALYLASGMSLSQIQISFVTGTEVQNELAAFHAQVFNSGTPTTGGTLAADVLAFDQGLLMAGDPTKEGDAETPTLARLELAMVGQYRIQTVYNDLFLSHGTYSTGIPLSGNNGWLSQNGFGTSLDKVTLSNSPGILVALSQTQAAAAFVSSLNTTGTVASQAQIMRAEGLLATGASSQEVAGSFRLSATAPQVWLTPPNVMLTGGAPGADGIWSAVLPDGTPVPAGTPGSTQVMPDVKGLFNIGGTNSPLAGIAPGRSTYELPEQEIFWFSDNTLRSIFGYLDANNISLSLQCAMGPQVESPARVSAGLEGFSPLNYIAGVAQKIKSLGGNLGYVAMDEPAFFNAYSGGSNYDSTTLANLMAINVRDVEQYFPNVQIGDIEPLGDISSVIQIEQFANAYKAATGQPLAFLRADIAWAVPTWQTSLEL